MPEQSQREELACILSAFPFLRYHHQCLVPIIPSLIYVQFHPLLSSWYVFPAHPHRSSSPIPIFKDQDPLAHQVDAHACVVRSANPKLEGVDDWWCQSHDSCWNRGIVTVTAIELGRCNYRVGQSTDIYCLGLPERSPSESPRSRCDFSHHGPQCNIRVDSHLRHCSGPFADELLILHAVICACRLFSTNMCA